MTLNRVGVQPGAFAETKPPDARHFAFRCPHCGHVSIKRRDSFAVGLHMVICQNYSECKFTTDKIVLADGEVVVKEAEDRAGGG